MRSSRAIIWGSPVGATELAVEAEEAAGVDLGHEDDREKQS